MEQSKNPFVREASTDERASSSNSAPEPAAAPPRDDWPEFSTRAESRAFWIGIRRGIRESGRDPAHPHMPRHFPLQLARDGAAPSLTSEKLLDPWPHMPDDEASFGLTSHGPAEPQPPSDASAADADPARAARRDGFTVAAEQHFLRILAETGVVADACRATGISRQAAYNRRNCAAGRPFALAWEAALLLSRRALADDVIGRARHGVIERVYRDGELVAERHRYDNRLTMAVLARLDRLAEGGGADAPVIQTVAQEFDQFLGLLPDGLAAAERFVAARMPSPAADGAPQPVREPPGVFGSDVLSGSEEALLARLHHYESWGVGLPEEIGIDDLDPAEMESWSEEQLERADASGFLRRLHECEWPGSVRSDAGGADGMCKVRQLYRLYHPPRPEPQAPADDFAGCSVWEEEMGWMTDFPPPPDFDGHEEGEWGDYGYKRELAPEEMAIVEAEEALDREESEAQRAAQEAARRRFFELDGPAGDPEAHDAVDANGRQRLSAAHKARHQPRSS